MAPAPSGAPPGQIHLGSKNKCCATLRPNAHFCCDARPSPPASNYKCGDKSNLFDKVPSRARETLTSEALQNSKCGNCHLASTKHLLLIMLEFRFAKFRGICTSQICIENVANLVSQLSVSSHLVGGCILGCPVASQIPKPMVAAKKPERTKARTRVTTVRLRLFPWSFPCDVNGTLPYIYIHLSLSLSLYIFIYIYIYSLLAIAYWLLAIAYCSSRLLQMHLSTEKLCC